MVPKTKMMIKRLTVWLGVSNSSTTVMTCKLSYLASCRKEKRTIARLAKKHKTTATQKTTVKSRDKYPPSMILGSSHTNLSAPPQYLLCP